MINSLRTALAVLILCCLGTGTATAQEWLQMHVNYGGNNWAFPYQMDHLNYFDHDDEGHLFMHRGEDEDEVINQFSLNSDASASKWMAKVDSINFTNTLTTWGKDKYKVFGIYITTDNPDELTDEKTEAKEWVNCYISLDGRGEYPDASGSGRIRGRGNSTLEWYPKKPYRIKFDLTSKMFGVEKNRDWVLLANYRDMTDVMNTFGFIAAKKMGIPFTSPTRYAELFINGEYRGIYQIAEQVEVAGHRVDIDKVDGLLLTLDVDDGPSESPYEGDNFYTSVYNLPMAVKNPDNPTQEQLAAIQEEFATLERAIQSQDYAAVEALMDIPSFNATLQLQELLYNVELSAPRSVFIFRDKGGKFTFGPAWDWDAGYDFNWGDMYTGHTFFTDYKETVLGSDPYRRNGSYRCSQFFTNMFGNAQFVKQYKEQWNQYADTLYTKTWEEVQKYIDGFNELKSYTTAEGQLSYTSPQQRENERWPVSGFNPQTETQKMKTWLQNRLDYVNELVQNYPTGEEEPVVEPSSYENVGTITTSVTLDFSAGYSQSVKVEIDKAELASLLGVAASTLNTRNLDLVPLDSDGTEGENTASGAYGAWFDAYGDTNDYYYGNVHVFIESGDLYSWGCGCHPENCSDGDTHTVRMEYRYATGTDVGKSVTVVVTFNIGEGGTGGEEVGDWTLAGTLNRSATLTASDGYHQSVNISVTQEEVAKLLGVDASELDASTLKLVPLMANGTVGTNTAGKTYGAWFDADGNTVQYRTGNQCVFIESDDLWTWNCGCEQSKMTDGDTYTVTMQYRYSTSETGGKMVNVRVKFTISGSGGWGGWGW